MTEAQRFIRVDTQVLAREPGREVRAIRNLRTGEILALDQRKRWVIGAAPDADLLVQDPHVSQRHVILERRASGTLVIRDNSSRNGTFLDGSRIHAAELRAGACIAIGAARLVALGDGTRALEQLRGCDPVLIDTIDRGLRAARTDHAVLVVGETGTGKDLLARAIHESSRRAHGPFVAVNCGAIARELVAAELFGHDAGAYTGASAGRDGYFIQADGGTLLLDEIGELPLELQAHLLRVIEARRVRRVGGDAERAIDVRIVAATHRPDALRRDLYHRLATIVLALPPLRERRGDLRELVASMLRDEHADKRITDDAWRALEGYHWPGNVRELRHAVARAAALGGRELTEHDFFPDPAKRDPASRDAIEDALARYGTIRAAAAALGMARSTFADKARALGIDTSRKPKGR